MKTAFWVMIGAGFAGIFLILSMLASASGKNALAGSPEGMIAPTSNITPTLKASPTPVQIIVEVPYITPPYGDMCETYWYRYTNNRNNYAYLTLNVNDPSHSYNSGLWQPELIHPGYYTIEAYIPFHPELVWDCPPTPPRTISQDTNTAQYTIQHANGYTVITGTQNSVSDDWLPLGEYLFLGDPENTVRLSDITSEEALTTTVSFSAMRFSWQGPPPYRIFLPLTNFISFEPITDTVGVQTAPAFDRCQLPTVTQMQTWWDNSPYRITNVYIGGGLLYHECTVPDITWIRAIQDQGWGIIPTWVGPQAPCSGWRLKMSYDPEEAYQQGQTEADAALQAAHDIGLTDADMGGSIIYYDMENYNPASTTCRNAVKSFINGWTEQMHYWGNRAGAYGGACTSYVSDWATIPNIPDDLWVAAWFTNYYQPNVPLFGITCLPDELWANHQRIRQYAYGHNETWGNVTINIDSNMSDAEVVISGQNISYVAKKNYFMSPENGISNLGNFQDSTDQGWFVIDDQLFLFSNSAGSPQFNHLEFPLMAIRKAHFVDEKRGWAIVWTEKSGYQLFATQDNGINWQEIPAPINAPGWNPISIQFLDQQNGWITEKLLTSSNFSVGRLHQTTDGGKSWQTYQLPLGEEARFITTDIGWVAGGVVGNQLFMTGNGGITWTPSHLPPGNDPIRSISLPVFYDDRNGTLPVVVLKDGKERLVAYTTHDRGYSWVLESHMAYLPNGITEVYFTTPQVGWAVASIGSCQTSANGKTCSSQNTLFHSQDSGLTWTEVDIPE